MKQDGNISLADLSSRYEPAAVYYEDADSVEYIRRDVPTVHRRVDGFLTLVLDLESRELIGFRLKGFKHFYIQKFKRTKELLGSEHFLTMVQVIEKAVEEAGNELFDEKREAYQQAYEIAEKDDVTLRDLPCVEAA